MEVRLAVGVPRICLLDQDPVRITVPDPRPRLIGPSETEGKLWLTRLEHLVERALEDPSTREPVVPVAERLDAAGLGHLGLGCARLGQAEIIEAQIGGDVR